MEKLIEVVDNLKKSLDRHEKIIKIKELNKKIKNDKELVSLIEKYKLVKDEKIKDKINKNDLFREYKLSENEVNFLPLYLPLIIFINYTYPYSLFLLALHLFLILEN